MPFLIILLFCIIGLMRVVQKVCSKKVSNQIDGDTYFHYGAYYQLIAAILSLGVLLVMLFINIIKGVQFATISPAVIWTLVGTFLCAIGMAAFIALGLFTEIEAMKGASLILVQMFAAGSLILAALFGHIFLGQKLIAVQWIGIVVFLFSMYLMISPSKPKKAKKSKKKAGQVQEQVENAQEEQAVEQVVEQIAPASEEAPVEEKPKKKRLGLKTMIMLILLFIAEGGQMIMQTVFGNVVENGNDALFSFLMFAINATVLYIVYLVQMIARRPKKKEKAQEEQAEPIKKKGWFKPLTKTLLICGAFLGIALTVINILATSLTRMVDAALLFSVSNAIAIIVTMLVGGIVYKEKVSFKNIIGILLCGISLTIIGVFM